MFDEVEMGGMVFLLEFLFNFYDYGDFVYFIIGEVWEVGQVVQQIEFKFMDCNVEYIKLCMNVSKVSKDVVSVMVFGWDGFCYKFSLDSFVLNKCFFVGYFVFNKVDYFDYYVEDLRE